MAGLIRQLLHQDARADKTALCLFDKAQRRAQRRYPIQDTEKQHSFVDAEAIAAELEWLLRGELYHVNLLDAAQYQAVLAAIEMWNPVYPFHESAIRQRCGFIQNGLLGLLPQLKRQQQLKQLCQEYHQHLVLTAVQHLKSQRQPIASIQAIPFMPLPPSSKTQTQTDHSTATSWHSNAYLSKTTQKLQAVEALQQTLQTRQDISSQCRSFQQIFKANRQIIEQDRDSTAMTFVKAVVTVFSLGLAALFGIWGVKGQKTVQKIEAVWQSPTPDISV